MNITSITRKISGHNYDNISVTATLTDGESHIEAAKTLDLELHKMLDAITELNNLVAENTREKDDTISLLEEALKFAKDREIPF